jgi:hypothetical protein
MRIRNPGFIGQCMEPCTFVTVLRYSTGTDKCQKCCYRQHIENVQSCTQIKAKELSPESGDGIPGLPHLLDFVACPEYSNCIGRQKECVNPIGAKLAACTFSAGSVPACCGS